MKIFKWIVWASIVMAILFIAITGISFIFNFQIFGVAHIVNFLHTANSFLFLAIAIYFVTDKFRCCDPNKK